MFFISRFSTIPSLSILLSICCISGGVPAIQAADDPTANSSGERLGPPVRSGSSEILLNLGQVNVHLSGAVCYKNPESITLWRKDSEHPEYLTLKNTSTNQQVKLVWQAGQSTIAWPVDKLAVNDGTNYLLKTDSIAEIIELYQMPEDLQNVTSRNAWLQEQGCHQVKTEKDSVTDS